MNLEIHPNATVAFNEKALQIAGLVERNPVNRNAASTSQASDTEPFISATLGESDIVGSLFGKKEYDDGRFTSATFINEEYRFEMRVEGCNALMALAESIWRAGIVATLVKKNFVDRIFFEWIASEPSEKREKFICFLQKNNKGITPAKLEVFICEPLKAAAGSLRGPLEFSH